MWTTSTHVVFPEVDMALKPRPRAKIGAAFSDTLVKTSFTLRSPVF